MFRFQQFAISQSECAMKVGTDGVLLGAWANGGARILDVGTGTGVVALMMAQRFHDAKVTAIDIDEGAVRQATENGRLSPFATRIDVRHVRVQDMRNNGADAKGYDAIVSNPPYFTDSLRAPDPQRNMARHADTLTYEELMEAGRRLLANDGELSVIVPFDYRRRMEDAATFAGFFPSRLCAVSTTARKPPRRFLLAFRRHPCDCQQEALVIGDECYRQLTADFYL